MKFPEKLTKLVVTTRCFMTTYFKSVIRGRNDGWKKTRRTVPAVPRFPKKARRTVPPVPRLPKKARRTVPPVLNRLLLVGRMGLDVYGWE